MLRHVDRHIDRTGAGTVGVAHLQPTQVQFALGLAVLERKLKLRFLQSIDDRSFGATVEARDLFVCRMQSAKLFQVDRVQNYQRTPDFLRLFLSRHSRRPVIP